MKTLNEISILILAAGEASRMQEVKQLLPLGQTNLLEHAVQTARNSDAAATKVVLGANREKIQQQIAFHNAEVVVNPHWKEGLGTSISAGISAILQDRNQPEAVLVMLADQPLVDSEHLNLLIKTSAGNKEKIIASDYGKHPGVPAVFPPHFFKELLTLKGDSGAKEMMKNRAGEVISISAKNKLIDLDTPEDYQQFLIDQKHK
ncbi:nucleotidyltransferase family protein [Gramella sp. AN32]|uniref:NTP transferase domain-containing protein n=1 Tax=Christiangramia antarctica TaxID=2058158 RepID=A0ABW5X4V0_9FLAO|nr:nucleotidyltransferase family protein [Gramella sp. AN32]MCM4156217.1 4-diphosphocytidyl-2C-methyl-D-erythritol synthase [Gramella sp. AN32]